MNRTLVLAVFALGLCACDSSIFYVEASESRLCKQVDALGPFPAAPPVASTVTNDFQIPVGDAIPLFDANKGSMDLHLLDLTLTPGAGLTNFNGFDAASMTLIPPESSGLTAKTLLSYTKGATPPGDTLVLVGDPSLNVFPYLQAGGALNVHAELSGTFPTNEWKVNVDPCVGMKVRLNYANLLLPSDAGI